MDHVQILHRGRVILIYRTLGQLWIQMETAFEIGWITTREDPPIHRGGPDVSLISGELRYLDQLHRYEYQTQASGLRKMHGLRHAYAQDGDPCRTRPRAQGDHHGVSRTI